MIGQNRTWEKKAEYKPYVYEIHLSIHICLRINDIFLKFLFEKMIEFSFKLFPYLW